MFFRIDNFNIASYVSYTYCYDRYYHYYYCDYYYDYYDYFTFTITSTTLAPPISSNIITTSLAIATIE